jgi:hypothetical protein
LDLPTATLLLGIATLLVTGYIAIQQWLTAKRKLRLDVFDRRLPVFEDVMSFTEIVSTKENITLEEVQKFKFATKSVRFLFNRQTQDYCDKLYMGFGEQRNVIPSSGLRSVAPQGPGSGV